MLGRVTALTVVLLKKVPLSSVKPDEDKSTDPVHELFVDEVAELTVTLPLTEQLWTLAAKVGLINLGLSSERIGVKSVPTKTAISSRVTRVRSSKRWFLSVALNPFCTSTPCVEECSYSSYLSNNATNRTTVHI